MFTFILIPQMKLAPKSIFSLLAWTGACHAPVTGGQGELADNTHSASPVPIGKSADLEMAKAGKIHRIFPACGRWNWSKHGCEKSAGHTHFEAVGITCKPKKAEGSPESRKAFWGEEEQRNE